MAIELLFMLNEDGTQYIPIVAAIAGFPWSDTERAEGIIAECPDSVGILMSNNDPLNKIIYPFRTNKIVMRGNKSFTRMDKRSSWVLNPILIAPQYRLSNPRKPIFSAAYVMAAIIQV